MKERSSLAPLTCALLAVIGYCLLVIPVLLSRGPVWFAHVGAQDRDPPTLRQVRALLGRDISAAASYGHDGREFLVLAHDPLLLSPNRDSALLDRPAYRAARLAYPLAVAPWGIFGWEGLLIGLLVTNLLVVAVGTYFTARLAIHLRAPPWASAFFAASPVVTVAVLLDLGDALSLGALVASFYLFLRERWEWATAAGIVAVLAKQPALLGLLGIALSSTSISRRVRILFLAIPTVVLMAWTAYATLRLGSGSSVPVFTFPLLGYIRVEALWERDGNWIDAVFAVALLPAAGIVVARWWSSRSQLLTIALPFALLVPFLSHAVLYQTIDSVRAFGPAITFVSLDWAVSRARRKQVEVSTLEPSRSLDVSHDRSGD